MAETIYNDRIDRVVYRSTGAVSDDDFWSLAWYYPALVQSPTLAAVNQLPIPLGPLSDWARHAC